jgi:hypothetical protein
MVGHAIPFPNADDFATAAQNAPSRRFIGLTAAFL